MNSPFRPRRFLPGILGADTVMPINAPRAALANPGNGPIAGYTRAFDFYLTNFDWVTWHDYEWSNWIQVDALLNTAVGFLNIRGIWRPLTAYEAGDGVYDPEDITRFYRALDDHTSGTDFATDIAAGHWELVGELGPPVTTVFGRIGDIVATAGDYDAFYYTKAQVDASQAAQNTQIAGLQTGLGNVYTKSEAEARYVNVAGDVMTGPLGLASNPVANDQAARKLYVDTGDAAANANADTRVLKSGDTMTGMLTLPSTTPSNVNHATRKGYVDAQVATRAISAYGPPQPTTPSVGDLWFDTTPASYGTKMWNGTAWVDVAPGPTGGYVPTAGGTMTGILTMSSDTPIIRFRETDAVSPAGQFSLRGYGTGSFGLSRFDGANWTNETNIWRYIGSSGNFFIETPLYLASGCDLTLNGGRVTASANGFQFYARAAAATDTAGIQLQNPDGSERATLYAAANNGNVVLRNRAGTGSTLSYLQLNTDQRAILSAPAGIDAIGGMKISGTPYVGNAGLILEFGYPFILFHDTSPSGAEWLGMSAGNGTFRFAVANSGGTFDTDLFTINPAGNIRAYLPIVADFTITGSLNHAVYGGYFQFGSYSNTYGNGFARIFFSPNDRAIRFSSDSNGNPTSIWLTDGSFNTNTLAMGVSAGNNYLSNTLNSYIGFNVNATVANSDVAYYFRNKDNVTMAAIYGSGTTSPNALAVITREKGDARYQTSSSRRYKDDIADADVDALAAAFDGLRLRQWTWGGEYAETDVRYGLPGIGFVAEEVEQVRPEAVAYQWIDNEPVVTVDENGTETETVEPPTERRVQGLNADAMCAILYAKVLQLVARVEELEEAATR